MEELAAFYKALADPTRLRLLRCLQHGELCVCDLMAALDMPQSTISRHLATMKHAGILSGRRGGKWMYYQLLPQQDPLRDEAIQRLIGPSSPLHGSPQGAEDEQRLQRHLAEKNQTACT